MSDGLSLPRLKFTSTARYFFGFTTGMIVAIFTLWGSALYAYYSGLDPTVVETYEAVFWNIEAALIVLMLAGFVATVALTRVNSKPLFDRFRPGGGG